MILRNSNSSSFIQSKLTRPNWVKQKCVQQAICVSDISPSMRGAKIKEASQSYFQFTRELARTENNGGFYVSVIGFHGSANILHEQIQADELVQNLKPLSIPLLSNGTNITSGLELASKLCNKNPRHVDAEVRWLRPVVILFSDGGHNTGPAPSLVSTELKEIADIVTVAYGSDADNNLLRSIATSSQHHYACKDGSDLRQFFASVGSTMTASLATGVDATAALTNVSQRSQGGTQ